jgi:hypothetical protein
MLPGISCEDRLYADLGVDPGAAGCQTYEATAFLIHRVTIEPSAALILLQIGVLGEPIWPPVTDKARLGILVERLLRDYPPDHEVVIYEGPPDRAKDPDIQRIRLSEIPQARVNVSSTLCVPPVTRPLPDIAMMQRLGIEPPRSGSEPGAWACCMRPDN